ncbi:MAG: Glycine oxidase [Herbaspirillum frisingense]|uniref:Glycine oxidase n=1 Tax=Herbaspirillum frisingense TaxID=92645 RepID=A0A7V8FT21_9BURK|nr:MAG: Glycine oxidase [Herbaspirillum frisingense]
MKVAIVGNGILGLMTARAWLHSKLDAEIVIIGRQHRPGSATRAAAAMLNSFAELEHDSLATPLDRFKFDLSRAATSAWPSVFEEVCPRGSGVTHGFGTFLLNNSATDSLDDDNFNAVRAFAAEYAEPCEDIAPRDIPNYHPDPRYRALRALLLKREGWVNPKQFLDALQARLAGDKRISLVDDHLASFDVVAGRIVGATLEKGGRVGADAFVLANGANLSRLAGELELPMQRVFYGIGMSIEMQSAENVHTHCVRTTNRGLACGVYSVPYGPDRTLIGASNYISPTPCDHAHTGSAYVLLKAAMDQINSKFYRANLVDINVGWRPTTSDTYPLIGKTSLDNLWIIGGTKRDGFHLSPVICGDLVAAMQGREVDPRYSALAPERALIRNLTREEAISKTIRHHVNAAFQHDFAPARNRMLEQMQRDLRAKLEALHDSVGARQWGIPPELVDMYRYKHIPGSL